MLRARSGENSRADVKREMPPKLRGRGAVPSAQPAVNRSAAARAGEVGGHLPAASTQMNAPIWGKQPPRN